MIESGVVPNDPRRIAVARLRSEAWRNGHGLTRTVATGGTAANGWAWRVSVAEITRDGPFSIFPGVDRHLALLDGRGLVLTGEARTSRISHVGQITKFAGEETLDARLVDGPVRVWNLMAVRGAAVGRLYEHDHARTRFLHPSGLVRFVTVATGRYQVRGPAIEELRLSAGEALRLDALTRNLQLRPVDDHAIALVSDIRNVSPSAASQSPYREWRDD